MNLEMNEQSDLIIVSKNLARNLDTDSMANIHFTSQKCTCPPTMKCPRKCLVNAYELN